MTDEQTNDETNDDDKVITPTAQPAAQRELDPSRPMFHLIPPSTMQDLLDILKALPYEDVHRVMPVLMQAPIHQEPPQG